MASTATSSTYRADHVGGFLRPQELLDARHEAADSERLREIEDREILRILAKQQELGFEIFTDGEFRRGGFMVPHGKTVVLGFASMAEGNLVTEADQWAKLQLVVDTARKVWG